MSFSRDDYDYDVDPPTEKQQAFMDRNNLLPDQKPDFYEAQSEIGHFIYNRRRLAPTAWQKRFLQDRRLWREEMTRGEAFDLISQYKAAEASRDASER